MLQVSSVSLYQARRTLLECLGMHLGVVIEIGFERISRVNAIIVDRHYQCISAVRRQLFLNSLKSSVITEKAKKMCRIHDARAAIAKRRNTK